MEKIVTNYPYSSVNKITNKKLYKNSNFGYEYQRLQNLVSKGKRIENVGEYSRAYDKIWSWIK